MSTSENSVRPKSQAQNWHWHSTPLTASRYELSVLAVAETSVAVGIYIWLALAGHVTHLLVAAIVAPLLLLRTDRSTDYALKHFARFAVFSNYLARKVPSIAILNLPHFLLVVIVVFLETLSMRVWATIRFVVVNPIRSLTSIPRNWIRITCCVDTYHPPELLPGFATLRNNPGDVPAHMLEPSVWLHTMKSNLREFSGMIYLYFPTVLLLAIPVLIFRWSIKGSSLIYVPLIWIAHLSRGDDVWNRLQETRYWSVFAIRRWFGIIVVGFVASKVIFQAWWSEVNAFLPKIIGDPLLIETFVAPVGPIPRWQLAAAANAIIAWVMFFIADKVLLSNDSREVGGVTSAGIRLLWVVGACLSLYTIAVTIYNVWSLELSLPQIGNCWVPGCDDSPLLDRR